MELFEDTKEVAVLKEQARKELEKHGLIVDGCFEGDFETWIRAYARPQDKPTALDPRGRRTRTAEICH